MATGKFDGPVPEEWRQYKAIQFGVVAAQPFDEQPARLTDLFLVFAALEHQAAENRRRAAQRR